MKELKVNFAPQIKKLEMTSKRGAFGFMSGEYRSVFKGQGLEFTGYKKYTQADDASIIDWKASLRAQELLSRELIEERNLEVMFIVDVSSSMAFASAPKLKCEYAAELVASLCFAILQTGDSVGLIMFTDKVVKLIKPSLGTKQFFLISRALSDPGLYEGMIDFIKVMNFAGEYLRKSTIVIIVSDFIGLSGDWKKSISVLGEKFDMIGIMIRDPRDDFMPDVGQVAISNPFSGEEIMIDTGIIGPQYEKSAAFQKGEVRDAFLDAKSDFIELSTERPFAQDIMRFFKARKGKWR